MVTSTTLRNPLILETPDLRKTLTFNSIPSNVIVTSVNSQASQVYIHHKDPDASTDVVVITEACDTGAKEGTK